MADPQEFCWAHWYWVILTLSSLIWQSAYVDNMNFELKSVDDFFLIHFDILPLYHGKTLQNTSVVIYFWVLYMQMQICENSIFYIHISYIMIVFKVWGLFWPCSNTVITCIIFMSHMHTTPACGIIGTVSLGWQEPCHQNSCQWHYEYNFYHT